MKKPIDQPIIFNSRAVREEIKEHLVGIEFWTCTLELKEYPNTQTKLIEKGNAFITPGDIYSPQNFVIDFKEELLKEDTPLSQMPYASLTAVIGEHENGTYKKLCEITAGEITAETYKALQGFMFDLQLNPDETIFNLRENAQWQFIRR